MSQRSSLARSLGSAIAGATVALFLPQAAPSAQEALPSPGEGPPPELLQALEAALDAPGAMNPLGTAEGGALEPTLLHMRDGGLLFCGIEQHDPDGLVVRRLDTGGRVPLTWAHIDPTQENELRTRFGYVEVEVEEYYVTAHRIQLQSGEMIGRILSQTPEHIIVKTASTQVTLPTRNLIAPPSLTQVPARDVYTREELYQLELDEWSRQLSDPTLETPDVHWTIAEHCERILDYEHAAEHYARAYELDPDAWGPEQQARLQSALSKKLVQDQVDLLEDADRMRARKQFDEALAIVDTWGDRFPASPLMDDVLVLRERILISQTRALSDAVVKKWHFWVARKAAEVARDMDHAGAMSYIEGEMSDEVAEAVRADMERLKEDITAEDVRALFAARERQRSQRASYGPATWLLGDEARAGLAEEEEGSGSARNSAKDAERQALEQKINRYIQNSQRSANASGASGTDDDPEAAWVDMSSSARAQFVRAWYAEHSGDMELVRVTFSNCRHCGGTGALAMSYTGDARSDSSGAGTRLQACPTCHTICVVRRVTYR